MGGSTQAVSLTAFSPFFLTPSLMNILILIGLINGTYLALIKDFDDLSNGDADND